MSDVASTVKEIIVEKLGVKESEVTPEANFTNDLGASYISADASTDTTAVGELVKAGTLMSYTTGGKPGWCEAIACRKANAEKTSWSLKES